MLRHPVCWYWKINDQIKLSRATTKFLGQIALQMKIAAVQNNSQVDDVIPMEIDGAVSSTTMMTTTTASTTKNQNTTMKYHIPLGLMLESITTQRTLEEFSSER
jgi:hypothetical protein